LSEGGHVDFAPRSELEFQLLKYPLDRHNIQRVSAERAVSGQGIVAIYQFLRDSSKAGESVDVGQVVRTGNKKLGAVRRPLIQLLPLPAALEKRAPL